MLHGDVLGASTAKICFTLAKTGIVDEVKAVGSASELGFVEFLEAFARIADAMNPPSPESIRAVLKQQVSPNAS